MTWTGATASAPPDRSRLGRAAAPEGERRASLRRSQTSTMPAALPSRGLRGQALASSRFGTLRTRDREPLEAAPGYSLGEDAVLLDMGCEPEGMVADEALGEIRVAGLEGVDDLHVLADRAGGAVVLAKRDGADRAARG